MVQWFILYQKNIKLRPYHWWCAVAVLHFCSVRLRYGRHPRKRPELWRHLERWEPRAGPADFPSGIAVAILQHRKVTITIIKFPTHSIIGGTSLTFKPLATTFATVTSRLRSGMRPLQRRAWAPNLGASAKLCIQNRALRVSTAHLIDWDSGSRLRSFPVGPSTGLAGGPVGPTLGAPVLDSWGYPVGFGSFADLPFGKWDVQQRYRRGVSKCFKSLNWKWNICQSLNMKDRTKTQDLTHKNGDSMDSHGDSIRGDTKNAQH